MNFRDDVATHRHMIGLGQCRNTPPRGDAAGSRQIDDGDIYGPVLQQFLKGVQIIQMFPTGDGNL